MEITNEHYKEYLKCIEFYNDAAFERNKPIFEDISFEQFIDWLDNHLKPKMRSMIIKSLSRELVGD